MTIQKRIERLEQANTQPQEKSWITVYHEEGRGYWAGASSIATKEDWARWLAQAERTTKPITEAEYKALGERHNIFLLKCDELT